MYYLNLFFFYSILGNIFERTIMHLMHKTYVSGFMGTIFTPVYGIGILVILFIHNKLKIKNKPLKIITEFILFTLALTLLELTGGILIEKILHKVFWNYNFLKYNIGPYISLEISLVWGVLSLLILYLVQPIFNKLEPYIPKLLTILISIFFIINLIISLIVK